MPRGLIRYRLVVAGYVVMPEHVHLLVSEPRKAVPATATQAVKLSVARRRDHQSQYKAQQHRRCGYSAPGFHYSFKHAWTPPAMNVDLSHQTATG